MTDAGSDLIEEMLPTALEVAVTVRDRDIPSVHAALAPVLFGGDTDRIAALIVALAVLVPDDIPVSELVSWTHGQEQLPFGQMVLAAGEKWCGSCQQVRARRDFHKDRSRKDGLYSRCKVCLSEAYQERKKRERQADASLREVAA